MRSISSLLFSLGLLLALVPASASSAMAQVTSSSPLDTNIVRIGHLGGSTSRIVLQGSYAYLGRGLDLVIMDISAPSQPRRAGRLTLPDYAGDIAIGGSLAYVAAGRAGLRVVDIHDPAAPTELGAYIPPDPVTSVAVGGGRVFLATNREIITGYPSSGVSRLYTLDVSNPATPTPIDTIDSSGFLGELTVDGSFLYGIGYVPETFGAASTLLVFDIAASGAPQPAGSANIGGYPGGMSIANQRAYISRGDRLSELMVIVDLSNPRLPAERGFFAAGLSISFGKPVPSGNTVFLPTSSGLMTVNVTDPDHPTRINVLTQIPIGAMSTAGRQLAVVDNDGISMADITNVADPRVVGSLALFGTAALLSLDGQYAYASDRYSRIWAIDIGVPSNPREIGYLNQPAYQFIPRDGYLYVASGEPGLQIADFRNPSSPRVVGRYRPGGGIFGIALNGRLAYLTHIAGLKIVDIANPTSPRLIADRRDLPLSGPIKLAGTTLYAIDTNSPSNLLILDVADAVRPRLLARYPAISDLLGVDGSMVFALGANGDVLKIDASTPAAPVLRASYSLPNVNKLAVYGRYLYATRGAGYGLHVFDIGTPARAREVASAQEIYPSQVAAANGLLFVADPSNGLHVLQQRLSIRGYIADPNGTPAAGVTVSAGTVSAQTDATGAYTITGLLSGTLALAPSQAGYRFVPEARTLNLSADLDGQNFTRLPAPVSAAVAAGQPATLGYADAQEHRTDIAIPGGALRQSATLVLTPTLDGFAPGLASAGHAFTLAGTSSFAAPLTATIDYGDADVRTITDEAALALQWWDGTSWRAPNCAGTIKRDASQNRIAAPICAPGAYRLVGPSHQRFLPLAGL